MRFCIVNESTEKTLTEAIEVKIASAVQEQVCRDYASLWQAAGVAVRSVAKESEALSDECIIVLLDNADQAGALGYHDVTPSGRPYSRIFVETILSGGGNLIADGNSVSVCISHEVLEALVDPYCNFYADNIDGSIQYAVEIADPVESDFYMIGGVAVSNFVGPRWFDPLDTSGPFDQMSVLTRPFQLSAGGYVISREPGKAAISTFGKNYPKEKQWKKDALKFFETFTIGEKSRIKPSTLKSRAARRF